MIGSYWYNSLLLILLSLGIPQEFLHYFLFICFYLVILNWWARSWFIFIFKLIVFKWFGYWLPVMFLKVIWFSWYRSHLRTLKLRYLLNRKQSASLPICIAKTRTQRLFYSLKVLSLLFISIWYYPWLFYLRSVCLFFIIWLWFRINWLINNYYFLRYHSKCHSLLFWVYWIRSWEFRILFIFLNT